MSIRKALTLAGLVLALAVLSPASTLAKAGGTDRPVHGSGPGTVSINVQTFAIAGDLTGVVSHLGKFTARVEATGSLTPEGTTVATGTVTFVAADGDRLTGDVTITGPAPTTSVHENLTITTITGGTGRFAHASGTMRTTGVITPFSFDGVTLLESIETTTRGRISY